MKALIYISFGAILQGLAMAMFLFPYDIPSGGAAGIAILLNYFFQLPYGVSLWLFNIVLLLVAVKWLGKKKTIATIYSVTVTSITIFILEFSELTGINSHLLPVDLAVGAVIFGCGVGVLFRHGSSSGGMAIAALLIEKYRKKPPGKSLFWMNSLIFLSISIVKDWKIIILAILCQWIATKVIDYVYCFKSTPKVKQEV